jgi:hypothetical protein
MHNIAVYRIAFRGSAREKTWTEVSILGHVFLLPV